MFSCCSLSLLCDILTTFESVSDIPIVFCGGIIANSSIHLKLLTVEGDGEFTQHISMGSFLWIVVVL